MKRWTPEAVFLLALCLSVFQRKFFLFICFSLNLLIYMSDVVLNIEAMKAVHSSFWWITWNNPIIQNLDLPVHFKHSVIYQRFI